MVRKLLFPFEGLIFFYGRCAVHAWILFAKWFDAKMQLLLVSCCWLARKVRAACFTKTFPFSRKGWKELEKTIQNPVMAAVLVGLLTFERVISWSASWTAASEFKTGHGLFMIYIIMYDSATASTVHEGCAWSSKTRRTRLSFSVSASVSLLTMAGVPTHRRASREAIWCIRKSAISIETTINETTPQTVLVSKCRTTPHQLLLMMCRKVRLCYSTKRL